VREEDEEEEEDIPLNVRMKNDSDFLNQRSFHTKSIMPARQE